MVINPEGRLFNSGEVEDEIALVLNRPAGREVLELSLPGRDRKEKSEPKSILIFMGAYMALISTAVTLTVCKRLSLPASLIIIVLGISFLESAYITFKHWRE